MSALKPTHKPWFMKHAWLQFWPTFAERLAEPPVVGIHPPAAQQAQVTKLLNVLDRIQGKTSLALPSDYKLELLETTHDPRAFFESAIQHFDSAVARSLMVPDKTARIVAKPAEGGSYSLAEVQGTSFMFTLPLLSKWLACSVNRTLVQPMTMWGFGPDVDPPALVFQPIEEENKAALVDVWIRAVSQGVVLSSPSDDAHIRELLSFPPAEEREAAMRARLTQPRLVQVA